MKRVGKKQEARLDWFEIIASGCFSVGLGLFVKNAWRAWRSRSTEYRIDTLTTTLLGGAVSFLPAKEREAYREEWAMFLFDIDNPLDRLRHSFSFFQAALVISSETYVASPARHGADIVRNAEISVRFTSRVRSCLSALLEVSSGVAAAMQAGFDLLNTRSNNLSETILFVVFFALILIGSVAMG